MTIRDVVTTLTILREQLAAKGMADDPFDELVVLPRAVKIKRGTKTLNIPLISQECLK